MQSKLLNVSECRAKLIKHTCLQCLTKRDKSPKDIIFKSFTVLWQAMNQSPVKIQGFQYILLTSDVKNRFCKTDIYRNLVWPKTVTEYIQQTINIPSSGLNGNKLNRYSCLPITDWLPYFEIPTWPWVDYIFMTSSFEPSPHFS